MSKKIKVLVLVVGVVALLGILGTGVALAADPPTTNYHDIFVAKVAKILGIDQAKLNNALNQARTEMIDEGVKAGTISKERADWMKQRSQGDFNPSGKPMDGRRGGRIGGPMGAPWQPTPTPSR
jgi:hypothetical protein